MPELPEVETVRRGLADHVDGRRIAGVEVLHPRSVRRHLGGGADLVGRLTGKQVGGVYRRGKYLWLDIVDGAVDRGFDTPSPSGSGYSTSGRRGSGYSSANGVSGATPPADRVAANGVSGVSAGSSLSRSRSSPDSFPLVVHLGMSGQMLISPAGAEDHIHLRVRASLDDGNELRFVDQRTFGGWHVDEYVDVGGDLGGRVPESIAHIAPDPFDPVFDPTRVVTAIRARHTEIKRALLDQTVLSGVGNIYADEALWRSRIHGSRITDGISRAKLVDLIASVTDVMRDALVVGGTSFDSLYVNVNGESGYFERSLNAYGRAGEPCRRCGAIMRREQFMNRSSYFCPRCQRRR
ncbi:bifunctional DNA-formamidopyrimidine glycosylase/DNA-(apurinic or apyrimidinic site) lyase [Gordonia sp. PKS22-38]|uniref:Formamidopyrimidine-DNA glycosylase n=1 Tax=Gordonia prachuapensis TaxID=3115651 RepID=A0ABU7MQZ3_9ACTN|nr:bifunctional DNA-formamidopyrimidine glycosylase/DNA-(apurinic or apyrimidinic site) lyase [Gordonia sp. PKS22-38]